MIDLSKSASYLGWSLASFAT